MKNSVVPAIIAKDHTELDTQLGKVRGKVEWVQLDFMDGQFVPNTSINFDFSLPDGLKYEAHLMVIDPIDWVKTYGDWVQVVIFHVESVDDISGTLNFIKGRGLKARMALNPETGIDRAIPYIEASDGIMIMTVHPGAYGGEFVPSTLEKIKALRQIYPNLDIEVDGNMNPHNLNLTKGAGANIFCSGSFIIKAESPEEAIKELQEV